MSFYFEQYPTVYLIVVYIYYEFIYAISDLLVTHIKLYILN